MNLLCQYFVRNSSVYNISSQREEVVVELVFINGQVDLTILDQVTMPCTEVEQVLRRYWFILEVIG